MAVDALIGMQPDNTFRLHDGSSKHMGVRSKAQGCGKEIRSDLQTDAMPLLQLPEDETWEVFLSFPFRGSLRR